MKTVKILVCCILIVAVVFLESNSGIGQHTEEDGYDCVIGIIFYGYPESEDTLSKTVFKYAAYLEENFNVKIEFASTLKMSQIEAVEALCELNAEVIINASTQAIPESIAICEEKQVYWLQIWDMPTDTDIVDKFSSSKSFLGCIKSNDSLASREMVETMLDSGLRRIGVIAYPDTLSTSNIHTVRFNAIQNAILEQDESAIEFTLESFNVKNGVNSISNQGYQPDGLITTTKSFGYTIEELKEKFKNSQLKTAYFDVNPTTRQDLLNGDLLIVACGQHSVIGLAFAYAYHYLTTGYSSEQKLDITSNYILIKSVAEYDLFVQYCENSMPYSADEISLIISSLDSNTELITKYGIDFSLTEVISRR